GDGHPRARVAPTTPAGERRLHRDVRERPTGAEIHPYAGGGGEPQSAARRIADPARSEAGYRVTERERYAQREGNTGAPGSLEAVLERRLEGEIDDPGPRGEGASR